MSSPNTAFSRKAVLKRLGLGAVLLLALALRLWQLDRNGYGTEYYSAGVRSMLMSWHNFLYNAFDPAGYVSLDKPPLTFWVQAASARLFGFSSLSILLPQVLEGLAAIVLLHHLVQRRFGAAAALIAAFVLAITPVSVAVDRSSNTESLLILVLLTAAWALIVATERGSLRLLVLAFALVGVAFNVKMVVAFVVAPVLALVYLAGAPVPFGRRIIHLELAGIVAAIVSLSWVVSYDIAAPEARPFAGGTRGNSMVELALWGNGLDRFRPSEGRARRAALAQRDSAPAGRCAAEPPASASTSASAPDNATQPRVRRMFDNVPAGPLRLADHHLAGQFAWLLPLALIGAFAAFRSARLRGPREAAQLDLALWCGWALLYGLVVFSFDSGIFHAYYLAMLAPPLAALTGIGLADLWRRYRAGSFMLVVAIVVTAAWQAWLEYGALDGPADGAGAQNLDWRAWLFAALIVGAPVACIALIAARRASTPCARRARARRGRAAGDAGRVGAQHRRGRRQCGDAVGRHRHACRHGRPSRLAVARRPWRRGERQAARVPDDQSRRLALSVGDAECAARRAPIIIRTGEPVMAVGGFSGADQILTPDAFAQRVAQGEIRFVMIGLPDPNNPNARGPMRARRNAALTEWVQANGHVVDPALWRTQPVEETSAPRRRQGELMQLYDLKPEIGLKPS